MVVLSEKDIGFIPPPPYFAIEHGQEREQSSAPTSQHLHHSSHSTSTIHLPATSHPSQSTSRRPRAAPPLPSHVLLLIVYSTLPQTGEIRLDRATGIRRRESAEETAVRTTRTLYWMAFCLRAVNRGFYLASMHILRSTFLPHYMQRVRVPYSSDPFPHTSTSSLPHRPRLDSLNSGTFGSRGNPAGSVVGSMQCESEILDLFILYQLHEDVFADDSSLHTARPERLRDLFDFMQPRARLTDLVRAYGAGAGLVALSEEEMNSAEDDISVRDEEWEDVGAGTSTHPSNLVEKRGSGLSSKSKLARSASSLTLINQHDAPSPAASYVKLPSFAPPTFSRSTSSPIPIRTRRKKKVLYTALRLSFSPKRVGLVYTPQSDLLGQGQGQKSVQGQASTSSSGFSSRSNLTKGPRTIVDIPRDRDEPLERSASRLVAGLKSWLDGW